MVIAKSRVFCLLLCLISSILLFPAISHAQNFQYRKAITIDHTLVPVTLSNFPVLISISNDNDLRDHVTNANGYDLVFTDVGGTQLDHEVESWSGTTGTLAAWVRVPSLPSTADTVIYMCYGNSEITTSQEHKTGVWDSNYKGVWHLPNGTSLTVNDSTSNANHGTNSGAAATLGMVDGAGLFNGSSDSVSVAHHTSLQPQNITLELWINPAVTLTSGGHGPFIKKDANSVNTIGQGYNFNYYLGMGIAFWVGNGSNGWVGPNYAQNLTAGTWYHVGATYDGTTMRIYLNGSQVATQSWTGGIGYGSSTNSLYIGYLYGSSVGHRYFNGTVDEVRISNVARSPEWVLAEYRNQSSPSTFYTVGSEEPMGSPINHAPVAQNQSVTTDEDTAKAITLAATDSDNDPLTYEILAQPSHGELSGTPPDVTYTPSLHYYGADSFTFKANDGDADSNVATVSITVYPPLLNIGQTVAGSISAPGEIDQYHFAGSVNDRITIRAWRTSGTFTRYLQLYGPGGTLIASGSQIDRTLTEEGAYRIDIRDQSNTSTGDYLLYMEKLNNPGNVVADLECGQFDSGSIGMSVDTPPTRIYTFTAAANEKVTIRTVKTSGTILPHIEFYNPAGTLIVSTYNQIDRTLTEAGSYKLLVRDYYNTNSGGFTLNWQKVENPCNTTPIECGQILSGTVWAAGEMNFYTFSASAGDVVAIRHRKTAGAITPYLHLFDPSGGLVTQGQGQVTRTLTATGTYRIEIRDGSNINTGSYILYLQKLNGPCNVTPLNCGQGITGSIGTSLDPAPWQIYTISVAANEAVTIRAAKISGTGTPIMEFYNPVGTLLVTQYDPINMTLTMAGTYSILVRDYSNAYAFGFVLTWQSITNPCNGTATGCAQAVTGSISAAGEMDIHTFAVSANDGLTIRVRKTSGTFNAVIELYGPNGTYLGASPTGKLDKVLTASGPCRIVVRDNGYVNTGSYLLYWQKTNNPCDATPINCGQVLTGSIGTSTDPPPWKAYSFTASAGDFVSIRSLKTSASTFISYMELYGPNGSHIGGWYNYPLEKVLTQTGTHTILIRDYYNAYAGDFFLTYQIINNPCNALPIACDQVLSGSISGPGDMDAFALTAEANDRVTIWIGKTSGTFIPHLEIITPSNARLADISTTSWTVTLTTAGTYKIFIRDTNYANTGDYVVYWQRWNNPCATPLACGQVQTGYIGTIADPPAWTYYTFNVSANDSVTIRAAKTSGALTPYIALYGPTGALVGGGANQLDRTLSSAGPHTIRLYDQTGGNTGEYLITMHKINNPCSAPTIGCGWVVSGSLSAVGKINPYTFTANSGDNVVLTLTKTSGGLDPSLELYNSSGTRLAYQYVASGNQAAVTKALTAEGTYTVFAFDYGHNETGSYTLKLQKNNNVCPEVTLSAPNGGDRLVASSNYTISWACMSIQGINTQEIRLSTDGGATYPYLIASGLVGTARTYDWTIPQEIITIQGRIRVTVTDTLGMSTFDESDSNFGIYQAVGRTYVYDELNRLAQVLYADGSRVTFTYDPSGNRLATDAYVPDTTPPVTTALPPGGAYAPGQLVTLTCNDGAGSGCDKIYYTNDGTTPTTASPVYSSPINVDATTTLQFFSKDLVGNAESVKTESYTISTNVVTVELRDSTGSPLSGSVVQYYSGGWQPFGTTDASGRAMKELLPGTYTFKVSYGFASNEKSQNTGTNPTVLFQTTNVTVQLKDSTGALMDTGTVQYYSGGWRDIGSTSGGQATKELLPASYTFSMNYAYARQEKAQNIGTNPTVVFQTTSVAVQLKDSTGSLMDTGTVQYYSGGWRDIGSTSAGQVTKELLPGSYTFSMNHAFARQEKAQNITLNATVIFQTVGVSVQLKDSTGTLMDTGTVQYYSGGWRDIGSTSGGQVMKELLPGSYTFSVNYAYARKEKAQNITADPTVVFQTGQVHSDTGACTQYYAGGWRSLTQDFELLPLTYTFRFNDGTPDSPYTITVGTVNHLH